MITSTFIFISDLITNLMFSLSFSGIELLRTLCEIGYHLEVPPVPLKVTVTARLVASLAKAKDKALHMILAFISLILTLITLWQSQRPGPTYYYTMGTGIILQHSSKGLNVRLFYINLFSKVFSVPIVEEKIKRITFFVPNNLVDGLMLTNHNAERGTRQDLLDVK